MPSFDLYRVDAPAHLKTKQDGKITSEDHEELTLKELADHIEASGGYLKGRGDGTVKLEYDNGQ